jgi:hypothetical protein
MKLKQLKLIILFSLLSKSVFCQYPFSVDEYTDSLRILGETIIDGKSDFARFEANEKFTKLLTFMLSHDNAIDIDFGSVRNLSVKGDKEKTFQIFTWVVPRVNMSYECFGIFYSYNPRRKVYEITELKDVKKETTNPDKKVFRKGEWWGALYYEIIPVKARNQTYYTLLGWDGNDANSTQKVIEVLSINSMGQPSFGATIFLGYGRQLRRVIFEYSNNTNMVLRYEQQSYYIEKKRLFKKRNKNKPPTSSGRELRSDGFRALQREDDNIKMKRKSATMIVFDRLAPLNTSVEGIYQFYVPTLDVVDGFLFINDKWTYLPAIEALNPPSQQDNIPEIQRKSKIPQGSE